MSDIIIELSQDISYAHNGEKQEANFIHIVAPNFKQMDKFVPIKQAFTSAVIGLANQNQNVNSDEVATDNEELTGKQIITVMMQSSEDMTKVYLHFAELFKSGTAMVGGEQKLTQPMIDAMPLNDFEKLAGGYIANFIAPSLMDGM